MNGLLSRKSYIAGVSFQGRYGEDVGLTEDEMIDKYRRFAQHCWWREDHPGWSILEEDQGKYHHSTSTLLSPPPPFSVWHQKPGVFLSLWTLYQDIITKLA